MVHPFCVYESRGLTGELTGACRGITSGAVGRAGQPASRVRLRWSDFLGGILSGLSEMIENFSSFLPIKIFRLTLFDDNGSDGKSISFEDGANRVVE